MPACAKLSKQHKHVHGGKVPHVNLLAWKPTVPSRLLSELQSVGTRGKQFTKAPAMVAKLVSLELPRARETKIAEPKRRKNKEKNTKQRKAPCESQLEPVQGGLSLKHCPTGTCKITDRGLSVACTAKHGPGQVRTLTNPNT